MTVSRIGVWSVCASAALAGCTAKDSSQSASVDSAPPAAAAAAPSPPKGALPGGWKSFTSKQFLDAIGTVGFTSPTGGERKCTRSATCRERGYISANKDAREITPAIAGTNGAVIARMTVEGSSKTVMYNLTPGRFTYYTVVTATQAGNAMNWEIVQVSDNKDDFKVNVVAGGGFHECNDGKGPVPAADWHGCRSHLAHTGNLSTDSVEAAKLRQKTVADGDGEGWVSCESGCCTLSEDKDPKNPKPMPDTPVKKIN